MKVAVIWGKYSHFLPAGVFMEVTRLGPYALLFSVCCEIGIRKKQQVCVTTHCPEVQKFRDFRNTQGRSFLQASGVEKNAYIKWISKHTYFIWFDFVCLKKVPNAKYRSSNSNKIQISEQINSTQTWVCDQPQLRQWAPDLEKVKSYYLNDRGRMKRKTKNVLLISCEMKEDAWKYDVSLQTALGLLFAECQC